MAEFVTVIREADRMCKSFEYCEDGCPFFRHANNGINCIDYRQFYPAEFEMRVMNWAEEHPKEGDTNENPCIQGQG